jgi:two-component system, OmpR family, sensor histidine kinase KdpD
MDGSRAENFLRLIRRSQRGRLKIYVGYAAGVGKTYQMLLEGHRIKADGIDVAIGLVETHGREQTEALLAGLEVIARRKVVYHGFGIEEMDLEGILSRHPGVVLVDELAHTNVPGSKNDKRYQDVEELLAAGIHVISTLNVQHIESLYETVERVTGVKVRERVPDRVVAEADQLVNVDITIEDLRRRLEEGKVYTSETIETALANFFKPVNLGQLRELTLREVAAQIDHRRQEPQGEYLPSSPDQVMVCLSSRGPNCEALLRYASRLAGRLNRNWYAVYVQTSQERPTVIDAETQRILSNTLTLAQHLGATVFTYRGDDIVQTILQFAMEYRVGHIVIGKPGKKISLWRRIKGEQSIVERLISTAQNITVVVPDTRRLQPTPMDGKNSPGRTNSHRKKIKELKNDIKEALSRTKVLIWDDPIEKETAISRLLDACWSESVGPKESAWVSIMEREHLGGTFVGEEVAIPHARMVLLKHPLVALGVGKSGIQDCKSGATARIMWLLLSPNDPPESHIRMLGRISRLSLEDQWRKDLFSARRPQDVKKAILKWDHVDR